MCCWHIIFFTIFITVLALQMDITLTYKVRHAITQVVFPQDVFGDDLTSKQSVVLTSTQAIMDWFESSLLSTVFADPACGDGECSTPLEFAAWRDASDQVGCEIDCGKFAPDTPLAQRRARVTLNPDSTMTAAEVAAVRWNLVCPAVTCVARSLVRSFVRLSSSFRGLRLLAPPRSPFPVARLYFVLCACV
jgi:hypothetical protein